MQNFSPVWRSFFTFFLYFAKKCANPLANLSKLVYNKLYYANGMRGIPAKFI